MEGRKEIDPLPPLPIREGYTNLNVCRILNIKNLFTLVIFRSVLSHYVMFQIHT
jgi:hypothetical protein